MKLRTLTPEELAAVYDSEMRAAFPPSELKPLSAMEYLRGLGTYDPLGAFDEDGAFLGGALLWKHRDGRFLLLDYLFVPAALRDRGLGGAILRALAEAYPPGAVFIVEAEAPMGDPERDALIARRLGFYRRAGGTMMDYECALFGVRYRNFCWGSPLPEESLVLRKHREIYRQSFDQKWFERFIQLPLAPGEAPRPLIKWQEGEAQDECT